MFSDEQLSERKRFIADKVFCTEEKVKWCTLEKAKGELQSIKESDKHEDQQSYIQEIENYLISEEERYQAYLLGKRSCLEHPLFYLKKRILVLRNHLPYKSLGFRLPLNL